MSYYKYTLALILTIQCLAGCTGGYASLPPGSTIDSIVVIKHDRELCVYRHKQLLKIYKIALGKQPIGAKQYEGDMRTPEGLYHICNKNPNSRYHKNLGVSYPSAADRVNALRAGRSTGGDIKIHGLPPGQGYLGALHRATDWTHGCIAVTNEEIDELFAHVKPGIPINILP